MSHEQTDLFGGATPLEHVQLSGNLRLLADAERELGASLSADEAGAILHEHRSKHPRSQRCTWCGEDGLEALARLRGKTGAA